MKIMITIVLLTIYTAVINAQGYNNGTVSRADLLGNRTITYNNGLRATLSGPDLLGAQTLRYNNGLTIRFSGPDILGNRTFTIISKARK